MVVAVPLSSRVDAWLAINTNAYIAIMAGSGGLPRDSVAILDHVQGIDERRLLTYLGSLSQDDFRPIVDGLRCLMGF
jgi:mRNA interferase MazF